MVSLGLMALLMLGVQCEGPVTLCCCCPPDEEEDVEGGDGDEDVVVVGAAAPSPLVAGPRCTAGEDVAFTSAANRKRRKKER